MLIVLMYVLEKNSLAYRLAKHPDHTRSFLIFDRVLPQLRPSFFSDLPFPISQCSCGHNRPGCELLVDIDKLGRKRVTTF